MKALLARWYGLNAREQNLALLVAFAVFGMLYVLVVVDPLEAAIKAQHAEVSQLSTQMDDNQSALTDMQGKLAADPNLPYRTRLLAAQDRQNQLQAQLDGQTAALISPQQMKNLLQTLLKEQPGLQLNALSSFSEPLQLSKPDADKPDADKTDAPPVAVLYRHGVRMQLSGSYFYVLKYLQQVEGSGWRLYWQRLDYRVGEAGPSHAEIELEVYTLSRSAEWIGV
ncbi:MSHA biogenesis protein MshJ [Atopomonas hussainii]|uniref:MSHA biogenesis protein MshJ n=1 Tax=Atopomonas hussainii TaxID=1429083 RepID=A0A1H7P5E8_9GAMM|nr:type II secretion system protein GspM [Atopomonas hussainii]SEL31090.1 MSHA biogenesis protein MshJ [Atopomonas hussainii]